MYPTNYHRFYGLLKKLPWTADEEDKKAFVLKASKGRTESLKELSMQEYQELCVGLERMIYPYEKRKEEEEERRYWRSCCLKLLQQIGVNTTCWNAVDAYCQSPKIVNKKFSKLSIDELKKMSKKLRMILSK